MRSEDHKSDCLGPEPVGTKVDKSTHRFITESAESAGVSTAEFLRRVIDVYRKSTGGNVECHNCGAGVNLAPGVKQ